MPDFIIRDFQSIQEAKISVKGFTLLIGESSAGKSACLRAIQAATTNRFKSGQIRNGCDHIMVKVKYEDKEDILQVRRNETGSPIAMLGKTMFSKMNRNLPPQIEEFNNFGTLEVGDVKYSLNFHPQFQKPLLLEFSQKKVMEILSASQGIDDLNKVHYSLSEKRQQNRGAYTQVSAVLDENNAKKSVLSFDIQEITPLYDKMEELVPQVESAEKSLNTLNELITLLQERESVTKSISLLKEFREKYDKLIKVSDTLSSSEELSLKLNVKVVVISNINNLHKIVLLCKSYSFDRSAKVTQLVESIKESRNLHARCEVLTKCVAAVSNINKANDTAVKAKSLISYLNNKKKLNTSVANLRSVTNIYSSLTTLESRQMKIDLLIKDLDTHNVLSKSINELNDVVSNHICPICKNKI